MTGEDFHGGWFRRLYQPSNPAGLALALGIALALIVVNQLSQWLLAGVTVRALFGSSSDNLRDFVKASLVVIFPASLATAALAVYLARLGGGDARDVLCLRWPKLGGLGWLLLAGGFMVAMYGTLIVIVMLLGIDPAEYTPGPEGQSPETGSAGLVKEAMFEIANTPWLFLLVFPSVSLGAPIAEEMIFRGQLFSALSQTRLGVSGTTVITAALWALMHVTETWLSVGLIFIMGLAFGWMMYRFGSLWVPMICHGLWNTMFALAIFGSVGQ